MRCKKCGEELDPGDRFCPKCGERNIRPIRGEHPAQKEEERKERPAANKKKRRSPIIFLAVGFIIVILLAAVFLLFFKGPEDTNSDLEQPLEAGDTVIFGSYEQDNDTGNGKEPIEWIVLENADGKMLLISKDCLDFMPYNEQNAEVNWGSGSIREWLNHDFADKAFSGKEKKKILTRTIENPGLFMGMDSDGSWIATNSKESVGTVLYQTEGSDATQDSVTLPSADEAILYLGSGIVSAPRLTGYAKEKFMEYTINLAGENGVTDEDTIREQYKGIEAEYGEGCCSWWLRSPGISGDSAALMSYGSAGIQVQNVGEMAAVRPVIEIRTD